MIFLGSGLFTLSHWSVRCAAAPPIFWREKFEWLRSIFPPFFRVSFKLQELNTYITVQGQFFNLYSYLARTRCFVNFHVSDEPQISAFHDNKTTKGKEFNANIQLTQRNCNEMQCNTTQHNKNSLYLKANGNLSPS